MAILSDNVIRLIVSAFRRKVTFFIIAYFAKVNVTFFLVFYH